MAVLTKQERRLSRARRTHAKAKISGLPRLVVFKSNKAIYAQLIDDSKGMIVAGVSGLKMKETGLAQAKKVGTEIAEKAKAAGMAKVSFDRNGYFYTGQVKELADAARAAGLEF
ncbi:50S ribosomal protein L18 [bacterium DOLZORAL124_38_8]|nr:MAG: 50S ribosomal protein L18 [bacterium DOLZORAL124_38_8]